MQMHRGGLQYQTIKCKIVEGVPVSFDWKQALRAVVGSGSF